MTRPPIAIICHAVASLPICEVAGASRRTCSYCGVECWISPASVVVLEKTAGAVVSCMDCYAVHGAGVPLVTTKAHLEEARAVLARRRAQAQRN